MIKVCQGCRKTTHDEKQYACDKCMNLGLLQDAINLAQTALNEIQKKWNAEFENGDE